MQAAGEEILTISVAQRPALARAHRGPYNRICVI